MKLPAWPPLAEAVDKPPRFGTKPSEAQNSANSCRHDGIAALWPHFRKRGRTADSGWGRAREAGVPGLGCVHARVLLCTSVCGTCGLGFVSNNKNHEGIQGPLGLKCSSFFFFPAWLQMCRGSESPLPMTSFPLFLNEALGCQEDACSAGHWAEGSGGATGTDDGDAAPAGPPPMRAVGGHS